MYMFLLSWLRRTSHNTTTVPLASTNVFKKSFRGSLYIPNSTMWLKLTWTVLMCDATLSKCLFYQLPVCYLCCCFLCFGDRKTIFHPCWQKKKDVFSSISHTLESHASLTLSRCSYRFGTVTMETTGLPACLDRTRQRWEIREVHDWITQLFAIKWKWPWGPPQTPPYPAASAAGSQCHFTSLSAHCQKFILLFWTSQIWSVAIINGLPLTSLSLIDGGSMLTFVSWIIWLSPPPKYKEESD